MAPSGTLSTVLLSTDMKVPETIATVAIVRPARLRPGSAGDVMKRILLEGTNA